MPLMVFISCNSLQIPENRRLIKEDRTRFEAELKEKINNGKYSKLSLCPSPNQGQNQQYKIEAI